MQNLKQKIMNNRQEFDHAEPGNGHFERFAEKLHRATISKRFSIPYYLKIAVLLILVSISSILIYEYIRLENQSTYEYTFGKISPEYREVEDFFIHNINAKYEKLENLNTGDADQKEMIKKELKEMDQILKSLSRELNNEPNNEKLINAMIQHYQMKLEIMNSIIGQLEEIKQIKLKNNENEEKEI